MLWLYWKGGEAGVSLSSRAAPREASRGLLMAERVQQMPAIPWARASSANLVYCYFLF